MRSSLGKTGDLVICILLVLALPQLSGHLATEITAHLPPIDPDGAFPWQSWHHVLQLLLTLLVAPLLGFRLTDIGFNLRNRAESFSLFSAFLFYFILFILGGHFILFFLSSVPSFGYPLTSLNIVGELGFKALLSGTAEEPLFRGLVMMSLFRSWKGEVSGLGIQISHAGIFATALFMIAHISFTILPFQITWISPIQLIQAGILGIFYAIAFDRTKSLLTPILAHNVANFLFTGVGMFWTTIA